MKIQLLKSTVLTSLTDSFTQLHPSRLFLLLTNPNSSTCNLTVRYQKAHLASSSQSPCDSTNHNHAAQPMTQVNSFRFMFLGA